MIELRWLIDPRSDAHKVLEYRTLLTKVKTMYYEDDIGSVVVAVGEDGFETHTTCWSEWQIVPEVKGG